MQRFPIGATGKGPAERFTGDVYVTLIQSPQYPSQLSAAAVRFTPGARSNWHSHDLGQSLYVTDGVGFVGTRDGSVVRITPGDTIWTPPGEEHWHGATDSNLMCHLALLDVPEGSEGTTWLEPVTDEQYRAAHQAEEKE